MVVKTLVVGCHGLSTHASTLSPPCLPALSPPQVRQLVLDMVLSTDMDVHFKLLERYAAALAAQPDVRTWSELEQRSLLFQMLVHLADLANPARPWPLALTWAEMVVTEFLAQVRRGGGALELTRRSPPGRCCCLLGRAVCAFACPHLLARSLAHPPTHPPNPSCLLHPPPPHPHTPAG